MLISYLPPDINTYTNTILFKERNPYESCVHAVIYYFKGFHFIHILK